tara:strand:+ start:2503 stop:2724 length:222 start_codon:yes stop_codon:yes gene_type:complete
MAEFILLLTVTALSILIGIIMGFMIDYHLRIQKIEAMYERDAQSVKRVEGETSDVPVRMNSPPTKGQNLDIYV